MESCNKGKGVKDVLQNLAEGIKKGRFPADYHATGEVYYHPGEDYIGEKVVQIRQHKLIVDEPIFTDQGPAPIELLLSAIASGHCSAIQVLGAMSNIPIRGVQIKFDSRVNLKELLGISPELRESLGATDSISASAEEIILMITIYSDADEEVLQELVLRAEQASPVGIFLNPNIKLNFVVDIQK